MDSRSLEEQEANRRGLSAPTRLIQTGLVIRPDEQLIVKSRCAAAERRSRAPHVEGNAVVANEDREETLGMNDFDNP